MTTAVAEGLFPGNYEDYLNDDVAKQREIDLLGDIIPDDSMSRSSTHSTVKSAALKHPLPPLYYEDKAFPADGRSLYFDPFNPPKGSIPSTSLSWNRICTGEVIDCLQPKLYVNDVKSSEIEQGALGNEHFVNAVRLLATSTSSNTEGDGYIQRLLVSDVNAKYGIYTFKFYKAGGWRYVHVDDRIPCRQSGKVNYCRNKNRNETFAMLLEKAYAKLHGCYEALVYGTVAKTLGDLTPCAHIRTWKASHCKPTEACDQLWDILEAATEENKLVGCSRVMKDAYGETVSDRKGITLNYMYQVLGVKVAEAEPTETLNALTVGMVCVRNLQVSAIGSAGGASAVGKFVGRWNYGHPLWVEYPAIGEFLRHATRNIQFRRGLGIAPTEESTEKDFPYENQGWTGPKEGGSSVVDADPSVANDDEISVESSRVSVASKGARSVNMFDSIISEYNPAASKTLMEEEDNDYDGDDVLVQNMTIKGLDAVQPKLPDIMWIQIEDFLSVFNRVHVITDLSFHPKYGSSHFLSRWIPGDGIVGSGGPPFLFPKVMLPLHPPVAAASTRPGTHASTDSPGADHDHDYEHRSIPSGATYGEIKKAHLDHDREGNDLAEFVEPLSERPEDEDGEEENKGIVVADDILDHEEINELEAQLERHNKSKQDSSAFDFANSSTGLQNAYNGLINNQIGNAGEDFDDIIGEDAAHITSYSNELGPLPSTDVGTKRLVGINGIERNPRFMDNPMYPISVNEPSTFVVSLLQADRRWSILRLGDSYRDITSSEFAVRSDRLAACMKYPMAIGFVIIKLSGAHNRVAGYRHRKVVAASEFVEYSHVSSNLITLRPGRYAIIPYTNEPLDRTAGYMLHAQYITGQVEFETEDLVDERPEDDSESENEPDTDDEDHIKRQKKQPKFGRKLRAKKEKGPRKMVVNEDGEEEEEEEEEEDPLEDEYESEDEETANKRRMEIAAAAIDDRAFPPTLLIAEDQNRAKANNHHTYSSEEAWEWTEEEGAESFVSLYEEIGELSQLVLSMRRDIKMLNSKMKNK